MWGFQIALLAYGADVMYSVYTWDFLFRLSFKKPWRYLTFQRNWGLNGTIAALNGSTIERSERGDLGACPHKKKKMIKWII